MINDGILGGVLKLIQLVISKGVKEWERKWKQKKN